MDPDTAAFFNEVRKTDGGNMQCFDCGGAKPQWASINHGILVCLVCSGIHRSLGVHTSFVRSITMDTWTESQRKMISKGGNTRAKEFFQRFNLNNLTTRDKYNTRAAQYYRNRLRAEVTNEQFEIPEPSIQEGQQSLITAPPVSLSAPAPSTSTTMRNTATRESPINNMSGLGAPDSFTGTGGPSSALNDYASGGAGGGGGGGSTWFSGGGGGGGGQSWTDFGLQTLGSLYSKAQETATAAAQTVQEKGVVDSVYLAAGASANWVTETGKSVATTVSTDDFWKSAQETALKTAGTATEALGKGMTLAAGWVDQQMLGGGGGGSTMRQQPGGAATTGTNPNETSTTNSSYESQPLHHQYDNNNMADLNQSIIDKNL